MTSTTQEDVLLRAIRITNRLVRNKNIPVNERLDYAEVLVDLKLMYCQIDQ
jgi:hypothetical protein